MERCERPWTGVLRDTGITLGCLALVTFLCGMLNRVGESDSFAPLLYVLAIAVIARLTNGYIYGIAAAVAGVFGVNFVFTYPYYAFNFTISGYPVTFICLLAVSVLTSALTTRIKEQERQRSHAEKAIARANLLRSVSHDFRTPLTAIIGSANALLDRRVYIAEDEREQMLRDVLDEAEWLKRMVENLMSVTRVGGDAGNITKTAETAEEILAVAAVKFRRECAGARLSIESPDELLFVPMDAMLIGQVLQNLLDNAVRHGADTSRILLSVRRDGDSAVFAVQDDGRGIEPTVLKSLRENKPIPRPAAAVADDTRNMGIGLSVCRTIIAAHGGRMMFDNNRGKGATVSFTLPLEKGCV